MQSCNFERMSVDNYTTSPGCVFQRVAAQLINVTDPTEVLALRSIHESLIDPNGHLSNWKDDDPCLSNWTGVVCSNETIEENFLHVVQLELMRLNLSGSLTPDIDNLAYLKILLTALKK
ncbi:hypothetical protein RYX36_016000 [Vicia faba]